MSQAWRGRPTGHTPAGSTVTVMRTGGDKATLPVCVVRENIPREIKVKFRTDSLKHFLNAAYLISKNASSEPGFHSPMKKVTPATDGARPVVPLNAETFRF